MSESTQPRQQYYASQSAEMEGLDLTDEQIEEQDTGLYRNTQLNNLSSINKPGRDNSYLISEGHHFSQLQGIVNARNNHTDQDDYQQQLDDNEAKLQEEVNQLDMLYAHKKINNSMMMQRSNFQNHSNSNRESSENEEEEEQDRKYAEEAEEYILERETGGHSNKNARSRKEKNAYVANSG